MQPAIEDKEQGVQGALLAEGCADKGDVEDHVGEEGEGQWRASIGPDDCRGQQEERAKTGEMGEGLAGAAFAGGIELGSALEHAHPECGTARERFEFGAGGRGIVVQDADAGGEGDEVSGIAEAMAEIDVFKVGAKETGIESADLIEGGSAHDAGPGRPGIDLLVTLLIEADALIDDAAFPKGLVARDKAAVRGPAGVGAHEGIGAGEIEHAVDGGEGVGGEHGVGICEDEPLALGKGGAAVSGVCGPLPFFDAHVIGLVSCGDGRGVIDGGIVDDNCMEIGVFLSLERGEEGFQRGSGIIGWDNDGIAGHTDLS